MNKATLKALKASIKHWQTDTPPMMASDCALCNRFHYACRKSYSSTGEYCPIFKQTGKRGCAETPYVFNPTLVTRKKEIEFLQSLLP